MIFDHLYFVGIYNKQKMSIRDAISYSGISDFLFI